MKINILIPYKEKFDLHKASAVSITVKNNIKYSKSKKNIRVFGQHTENPFYPKNFYGVKVNKFSLQSKNILLANQMCNIILNEKSINSVIEIHNRPYLFYIIRKKITKIPILIFFHNNPLEMKGSKTIKERMNILSDAAGIVCVSQYIKEKFLEGISSEHSNIHVLHNGVERNINFFPNKKKEILYVGRIVPEKGVDIFVNSISKIAHLFREWSFCICGSTKLGNCVEKSHFALEIEKKFKELNDQACFTGYLDNDQIQKRMQQASILVVPSIWEEPFGLVVAEGMSNGCAIIASDVGGIKEIVRNNGMLLEKISEKNLSNALIDIMSNKSLLNYYQQKAWKNFSHSSESSSKKLDEIRELIIEETII